MDLSLSLDMREEQDRRESEERKEKPKKKGTRNDSAGGEAVLEVPGMCYLRDRERVGETTVTEGLGLYLNTDLSGS